MHCPAGNATDPTRRVLASSDGISSWTPLKPQQPCWLSVQWEPSAYRSCQCCQKKGSSKVCGWICSIWPSWVWESQNAYTGNSVSWSRSSTSSFYRRSPEYQEQQDLNRTARPSPCCHDNVFLSDLLWAPLGQTARKSFRIFSSSRIIVCTVPTLTSNCELIVSIDTRRSLSMKFFIWPINYGVQTSLLLTHFSLSLIDSLPSLNLLCHSKTDVRWSKISLKHSVRFYGIFSKFKTEFYCKSFF